VYLPKPKRKEQTNDIAQQQQNEFEQRGGMPLALFLGCCCCCCFFLLQIDDWSRRDSVTLGTLALFTGFLFGTFFLAMVTQELAGGASFVGASSLCGVGCCASFAFAGLSGLLETSSAE
jgi:hypothetical protein